MINNTRYLKQSNNFKTFTIDDKRLEQLTQSKYCFFKYSKAMRLRFCNATYVGKDDGPLIDKFFCDLYNQWDKIEKIHTNNGLFESLFRSIKSLSFGEDGMPSLGKMPVKIMFGIDSQLETLKVNHYWNSDDIPHYQWLVKEFEQKYISLQNEMKKQGQKIKRLKVVEHRNDDIADTSIGGLRCISTDHLCLTSMVIDLDDVINIRVLRCKDSVRFGPDIMNDNYNGAFGIRFGGVANAFNIARDDDGSRSRGQINMETLRLLNVEDNCNCWYDILNNRNVIESHNLDETARIYWYMLIIFLVPTLSVIIHVKLVMLLNQCYKKTSIIVWKMLLYYSD